MELQLVTEAGKLDLTSHPCEDILSWHGGNRSPVVVPGLDAALCRCEQCLARSSAGIWWVDEAMRNTLQPRHRRKKKEKDGGTAPLLDERHSA